MSTQNFGLIKAIFVQSTPPTNTNVLWRDTTVNRTKEYDPIAAAWVALRDSFSTINWGTIGGLLSNQTDLQSELTTLQTNINTNLASINSINTTITGIQSDITTIESDVTTLQSQIHTQGTDQGLDTGGPNAVTAADIRAFIDSKAQNGGLASLDSGGRIPLSQIPDSIRTSLQFQGTWNASSNTPTLASGVGTQGHYYIVGNAGGTDLDGETDWDVGDWAIFNATAWSKVDNSERVSQVNGQVGIVTLTTSDIAEGTNLYYTENRVNSNTNVAANTVARHVRNQDQFFLPAIATETQLRALPSASIAINTHIVYRETVSATLFVYKLINGTDADDSPTTIRPDDYAAVTNERIWVRALTGGVGDMLRSVYDTNGDGIVNAADISTNAIYIHNDITTEAGLKAIVTLGLDVGIYVLYKEDSTNLLRVYRLEVGTAAESSPEIIRPNDYSVGTNEKVWILSGGSGGNPRGAGEGLVLTGNDLGLGGSLTQFASINTATFGFAFTSAGQTVTFGQNALSIGDIANAIIQADQGLTINSNAGGNLSLQSDAIGIFNSIGNLVLSTALNNVGNSSDIDISTGDSTGTTTDSGSINITTGTATGTRGSVVIQGLTFPLTDGSAGQVIATDGSNVLTFTDPGATNAAAEDEIPTSDANGNLVGSALFTTFSTGILVVGSRDRELRINAGNNTAVDVRNILISTVSNQGFVDSGNVSIFTGSVIGTNNQSGDIVIQPGSATSGATQGNISLNGLIWPSSDGTNGQAITTDGSGILSFTTISGGGGDTRTDRATVTPTTTLDLSTAITQVWTLTSAIVISTITNLVNNQETLIDKRGNFPLTINTTNFPNARVTGFPQSNNQDILIRVIDATNNIFRVAYLDSDLFLGIFPTLTALQTAFPTAPIPGAYAHVDAGSGTNLIVYAYDEDEGWVQVGSAGGGITNGAANNEIPVSDGTNLIGSGIDVTSSASTTFFNTADTGLTITAGDSSSATARNIILQTQSTLDANDSGNVTISTGGVTGGSNVSGNINITPGAASSGANSGNVIITLQTKPSGSFGHFRVLNLPDQSQITGVPQDVVYDQGGFLRITGSEITPSARITILTSSANATSMNFASDSGFKEFGLSLGENTTISFSNATNRSSYKIFLTITGASRTITLPVGSKMPRSTSNLTDITWTSASRQLVLPVGDYELAGDYNGTSDFWKITDLYE